MSKDINAYYKIGYIMKPHGLKGEVTITLDDAAAIPAHLETLFLLDKTNTLVPYFIEEASVKGMKAFIKFEDIDDPDTALQISKRSIYLPKSARPKAGRGEFYDDEIQNFEVWDNQEGLLGKVMEVIYTGANKLLKIERHNKEILIPVNGPLIKGINKSKRKISVDLPEGFLDI